MPLTFSNEFLTSQLRASEYAFQACFLLKNLYMYSYSIMLKGDKNIIGGWQNSLGKTKKSPKWVMHKGMLPIKRGSLFLGWSFYRHIAFRLWWFIFFSVLFYLLQTRGLRQPLWRKTIVNCEMLASFLRRFHWQSDSDKVSSTQLWSFCHERDEHLPVGSS